jgi:hypothetical protein
MRNILPSNLSISTSWFQPEVSSKISAYVICKIVNLNSARVAISLRWEEVNPPISRIKKSSRWTNTCVYWDWADFSVMTSQWVIMDLILQKDAEGQILEGSIIKPFFLRRLEKASKISTIP